MPSASAAVGCRGTVTGSARISSADSRGVWLMGSIVVGMNRTRNGRNPDESLDTERVRASRRNLAAEHSTTVEIDGHTFEIWALWDLDASPALVDSVTVSAISPGAEVTPRTLRRVPLGSVLDDMRREIVAALDAEAAAAPVRRSTPGEVTRADVEAAAGTLGAPPARKRPGPAGTPDAVLRRVAAVYRQAVMAGDRRPKVRVAQVVGAEQGVEHDALRQAESWVKSARRRGFLAPGTSNERRNDG